MIHVKQYRNKKLYLVSIGRYTDLNELKTMVQSGETIEVTDHDTGADLTAHILSQCVVLTNGISAANLADMIRSGK